MFFLICNVFIHIILFISLGVIKEAVKMVFDTKIYVDKDELRAAVEAYLQGNHVEYFNSFDRTG